ncbi:disks large homolog 1 isoform X1 [Lates japonicus]|uniref:Disks large homolog 1 isoform X1 n=1 Tax=Lates japonicus TaxID=270547 RepID=A0AAD3M9U7_LATJO|nr:disks large homolog 1 isoform X1 [Lates japonicus]
MIAAILLRYSEHRALFDYDGSASDLSAPNQALPFHFGDILHVSSASEEEWWPARHLSPPPPNCPEVGVIPSRRSIIIMLNLLNVKLVVEIEKYSLLSPPSPVEEVTDRC